MKGRFCCCWVFFLFIPSLIKKESAEVGEDYGKPLEEEEGAGGEMEVELVAALFIHR